MTRNIPSISLKKRRRRSIHLCMDNIILDLGNILWVQLVVLKKCLSSTKDDMELAISWVTIPRD
jgi:hypothetical protein